MNFILSEATFLRYFCPIVIEGNRRNVKSNFFINSNNKYNNCCSETNAKQIQLFCKQHNVNLYNINEINNFPGLTFVIEGVDARRINKDTHTIVSITYQSDFTAAQTYQRYYDDVHYNILPSKFIAEYYNVATEKNLYFGSPKYDYVSKKIDIEKRYSLKNEKYCLIVFPKLRDATKVNINNIYDNIKKLGYRILVKTRGKDPIRNTEYRGDHYFEDFCWFPHTTLDLIQISDFVVNFDSTTIKECVLLKKPLINFKCKPFNRTFDFLYKYDYCLDMQSSDGCFKDKIKTFLAQDYSHNFNKAIKNHLFEPGEVSKHIIQYFHK
tara:strand:+ start:2356 stop:3327 length:972 start_codon:yes stop_codon:yes gene_type:complete